MSVRPRRIAAALVAAAVLALTGACTSNTDDSDAPDTSTTSGVPAASTTPTNQAAAPKTLLKLVPIGNTPVTVQPKWKSGQTSPEAFLLEVLRYTQTLAVQGGVPVPAGGLQYHMMQAGQILDCDATTVANSTALTTEISFAIMWCPVFKGFAVRPGSVSRLAASQVFDLVMMTASFYGNGVAQIVHAGELDFESSCYHGLVVRRMIQLGQVEWDVALRALSSFYDGGVSDHNEGVISGTCKNIQK